MSKRKLKRSFKWGLPAALAILVGMVIYLNITATKVIARINWELGSPITLVADDFFTNLPKDSHPVLVTDLSEIDPLVKGDVQVTLTYNAKTYTSTLEIIDTTAPIAITKAVTLEAGSSVDPSAFIESITDFEPTHVEYKKTPSFEEVKAIIVTLIVSDDSGNKTEVTATANVVLDLTPPMITIDKPLYLQVRSTNPNYWAYARATDTKSTIESTAATSINVNLNRVGVYSVRLKATDAYGNVAETTREVHVVMKPTFLTMQGLWDPDNNKAQEVAQAVYDSIITPTMTQREKMRAVYDFLVDEMTYRSDDSDDYNIDSYNKLDEYALNGFNNLYGNCFYYASMGAILLDKIGMEVTLIKGEGYSYTAETHFVLHYWILVNVDGKTYHFDPLYEWLYKRVNKDKYFFLVPDAQIYDLTHRWDPALYPASPK